MDINALVQQYCLWDPNVETRTAISQLHEAQETEKLTKLLTKRLAFGTAGLRGPMGAGYNQMNDLVILQTTQGIIKYMESVYGEAAKSMVISSLRPKHCMMACCYVLNLL
jgi:phosphoglucomutase / phosphopentomutase